MYEGRARDGQILGWPLGLGCLRGVAPGVGCELGKEQRSLEEGAQRHLAGGQAQLAHEQLASGRYGPQSSHSKGVLGGRSDLHIGAGSLLQRCSVTNSGIVQCQKTG